MAHSDYYWYWNWNWINVCSNEIRVSQEACVPCCICSCGCTACFSYRKIPLSDYILQNECGWPQWMEQQWSNCEAQMKLHLSFLLKMFCIIIILLHFAFHMRICQSCRDTLQSDALKSLISAPLTDLPPYYFPDKLPWLQNSLRTRSSFLIFATLHKSYDHLFCVNMWNISCSVVSENVNSMHAQCTCLRVQVVAVYECKISGKLIRQSGSDLFRRSHIRYVWVAVRLEASEWAHSTGDWMGLTSACPFGLRPRRPRKSGISQARQGHLIPSPHPITALSLGQMRSMHGGPGDLAAWWRCDNQ